MKSVIRFILIMLCILFYPAQDIRAGQLKKTVYTNGPGTLNQVISSKEKYEITDLTICGSINGTDWLFIQEMMGFKFIYLGSGHEEGSFKHEQTNGKLESLNLWQANIVAGGDFYSMGWGGWPQEYTKDNTITSGMFNFAFTYIDYKLKEVVLPNSVKTIESKAFCFVHNLKSVTVGMNVEDMKGSQIFYGCSNMETLIFLGDTPPVMFENNVFSSIYRMPQKIYVPSNAAELYDATPLFTNLKTNGSVSIHQLYYLTLNNQFQGELPLESVSPAQMELISYNPNRSAVTSMFSKNYINDYTYWVKDDEPVTINMKPVYDQYGIEKLIKESTDTGIREDVTCNVKCYGNGIYDYELGIVNTNITIDPQLNTVELFGVEDQERPYGSSNELRYYHYPSGYPDEKQYTTDLEGFLLCDADPTSSCGEYSVKVNPDFPFRPLTRLINTEAKLNVKEAELMIIGPTIEREYGQPNSEVKFEYFGFVNGETPAILTHLPVPFIAQTEESPVGEYEIGMGYAEAPNYEIHYTTGLLRITKASLTIKAQSCSRVYGKPNPPIELIYEGFMNNETESVLTKSPIVSIAASEESNVGEYPISVNGAEAQNYSISYEPGVLTITQADQTIEWVQDFTNIKIGDEVDLTAIASSGLAIEYSSSNPDVAIIENDKAKFLAEGTATITAIQRGDDNYNKALSVEKEISVSPIYVETISLNTTEESMEVGMTLQLEAVIVPESATTKDLRWESAEPAVASISESGLVSALEVGTTTITAFATDGSGVSASCVINVSLSNGINTINEDGLKITIERNRIILHASDDNLKIDIFNISGRLVYQGNDRIISLPSGIYIMSVSGNTYKIIL